MRPTSIKVHRAPLELFEEFRERARNSVQRLTGLLLTRDGNADAYHVSLVLLHLERIGIDLGLPCEPDQLSILAARAAEHAGEWAKLKTPTTGPSSLDIGPGTYEELLDTLIAFSPGGLVARVAVVPEESYQTWGVFLFAYASALLRARRAWIVGDEGSARRQAEEVGGTKAPLWALGAARAMVAMIDRNEAFFHSAIDDMVLGHRKEAGSNPRNPRMFFCLTGLAICRMALTYGYAVEDRLYLPTRLLPASRLR